MNGMRRLLIDLIYCMATVFTALLLACGITLIWKILGGVLRL